jgi:GTP-dependent phosphoenolpyruvate carboxykinase
MAAMFVNVEKNSIFTNVAETADGGFYWEGMEDEVDKVFNIMNPQIHVKFSYQISL